MNVAIGIWVLLAGGWALPSSDDPTDPSSIPRAGVYNATEPSDPGSHVRDALSLPTREPQMSQPSTRGVDRQPMPGYAPAPRRPSAFGGSTMRGMMPMSPTDASARRMMYFPSAPTDFGAGGAMPMPPTMAGGSYGGGGPRPGFGGPSAFGRSSGGFGNTGQASPMMRSYTRWRSPRYASNAAAQIGSFGSNAGAPAGKAFSDYRATPAVSPYMNIFNTGTAGGTISPYNSLVRPQLDQNQQNQQLNTGLGDLQNQIAPLTAPPQLQNSPNSAIPQYNLPQGNNYTGNGQQP